MTPTPRRTAGRGTRSAYLEAGRQSWGSFDHFWWNTGYTELAFGLFPVAARDAYYGPFRASRSAPAVLVVGTRYDPATPYRGSLRAVAQLGNARLLTMVGDGHTAYGGNSPCIDRAVNAYLEQLMVPARATTCQQRVPFAGPEQKRAGSRAAAVRPEPALRLVGPLTKPLLP
ncbi:MAG: alpha/beta hydrolase [Actinomycetota bacterium]|nr:alpha/beta hydrolase [Actinomycetota bacterium]